MPVHDLKCPHCEKLFFNVVTRLDTLQACDVCTPLQELEIYWTKAPAGFVQKDVCYDSPIDGRAITSMAARREDLRRNDCLEYEPGMKQDAERKRKESDLSLDKSVDATVDQFFATAPQRKLEKLEQELRAGASAEVTRASPAQTN